MMIKLRPIDPAKNMRRFYRLDTQPDFFGGVFLMKEWGRIGTPGRVRFDRVRWEVPRRRKASPPIHSGNAPSRPRKHS